MFSFWRAGLIIIFSPGGLCLLNWVSGHLPLFAHLWALVALVQWWPIGMPNGLKKARLFSKSCHWKTLALPRLWVEAKYSGHFCHAMREGNLVMARHRMVCDQQKPFFACNSVIANQSTFNHYGWVTEWPGERAAVAKQWPASKKLCKKWLPLSRKFSQNDLQQFKERDRPK